MVVVVLSRLCKDEAVSHNTSAVYCRRCDCDSLLWVMGDVYSRQYHTRYRVGSGDM